MDIGWPEIVIIAVVIFALFGYKKLPDATRALGRSMRIFKAETRGLRDDEQQTPIEAAQPEVARPNPSADVPAAAALPPEAPVNQPQSSAPANEPR